MHLPFWCKKLDRDSDFSEELPLASISKTSPTELHCFCRNPSPDTRNKGWMKKRWKEREERKISSWLPLTIANSSFPLRRHCKPSWNHTLQCGQGEIEKNIQANPDGLRQIWSAFPPLSLRTTTKGMSMKHSQGFHMEKREGRVTLGIHRAILKPFIFFFFLFFYLWIRSQVCIQLMPAFTPCFMLDVSSRQYYRDAQAQWIHPPPHWQCPHVLNALAKAFRVAIRTLKKPFLSLNKSPWDQEGQWI